MLLILVLGKVSFRGIYLKVNMVAIEDLKYCYTFGFSILNLSFLTFLYQQDNITSGFEERD